MDWNEQIVTDELYLRSNPRITMTVAYNYNEDHVIRGTSAARYLENVAPPGNDPKQSTAPPPYAVASKFTAMACIWVSGIALRHTSPGEISKVEAISRAAKARFATLSGTVLGREVVPLVCTTMAVLDSDLRGASAGRGGPKTWKRPA